MAEWTVQQAEALAPDAASLKAGRDLAGVRKWALVGRDEASAWGLCQGSGKDPYQTAIDLSEPAFRCSCPSRKFPCKHGLGLLLLLAGQPGAVPAAEAPAWVTGWLESRAGRSEKKAERAAAREDAPPDPEAQAKRAEQRMRKVTAGVEQADLWLRDLVRAGLSGVPSRPVSFWESIAARMVDAQAPGLARLIREASSVHLSGEGWQDRLLGRLGLLHLLLEGFRRLDGLPPPLQAEVRSQLGWTLDKEEVLAGGSGIQDRWLVAGVRVDEEDRLKVQRTWLLGRNSGRPALLLAFAPLGQPLEAAPAPGSEFDAELVYYPGAWPLRALIRTRGDARPVPAGTAGMRSVAESVEHYGTALAANPWLDAFPMALAGVVPHQVEGRWQLVDEAGASLRLAGAEGTLWSLRALSGGRPLPVLGEWNGERLLPHGVLHPAGFVAL